MLQPSVVLVAIRVIVSSHKAPTVCYIAITYLIEALKSIVKIGENNFGELPMIRQIRQSFLPAKFSCLRYSIKKVT